jgi:predicted glycogen debranching enzyme
MHTLYHPRFVFDPSICHDPAQNLSREWLVTNGIGGYAAGTIGGALTRRYHGYLLAALQPPLGRTLLVSKFDETLTVAGQEYALFTNHWQGIQSKPHPAGYLYLQEFVLDAGVPTWSYEVGAARLEKRLWMAYGENTTYIQYHLTASDVPVILSVKALANYRDSHANTHASDWQMHITSIADGLKVQAFDTAVPYYLWGEGATLTPAHVWYRDYFMAVEAYRGLDPLDDHLYIGSFDFTLYPDTTATLIASTSARPAQKNSLIALKTHWERTQKLIQQSLVSDGPDWIQQLVLAADQFIVKRAVADNPDGRTVIAGYPWFGDWGRDTMISLAGLTLTTGRFVEAASILRTFARFVDQGMLPNRFPDTDEHPEYNTVDATLWYFEAIYRYYLETRDLDLVQELFPVLREIIDWHQRGTRYQIQVDPADGLLYSGEEGVQLTWMDVKIGDWVVTPRTGKAVEINALWYNALRIMAKFAALIGEHDVYSVLAMQVAQSFERFWNAERGYCFDVLDTPDGGNDASLRPNQLLAISIAHPLLTLNQQKQVVDVCIAQLWTKHGLRSLGLSEAGFIGHYGGDQFQRDSAYHQGTVWGWLLGPLVVAHWQVYHDAAQAQAYLAGIEAHLREQGLGTIAEIFDGDAPFTPRGCFAQAWSVAEVLRVWHLIEKT